MQRTYVIYAVLDYDDDPISVYFPDAPGCFSYGRTTEEALRMAKEALELYLDGMKEEEIPSTSNLYKIQIANTNKKAFPIEVEIRFDKGTVFFDNIDRHNSK